ncbi:MAG: hypothetical protein IJ494_08225 [Bacteroides sp.]|nr:hypothetical protein [Bacteroides sp.]
MKYIRLALTLCLGIAVFGFFGFFYTGHLSFHEEFQLFLYDADYWWQRVAVPGGVCDYLAEFLTQYYFHPLGGAAILAVLLMLLQRITWWQMRKWGTHEAYYPFSLVPALMVWAFLCSENALLSFPLAVCSALWVGGCYPASSTFYKRCCFILIALPVMYWVAGPAFFLLAGVVLLTEVQREWNSRNRINIWAWCLGMVAWSILCPLLAGYVPSVQYSVETLFYGINYYRHPLIREELPLWILGVTALLPFVVSKFPQGRKRMGILFTCTLLLVGGMGYKLIASHSNMLIEEALEYDRLARFARWNEIIEKAGKTPYNSPVCATYLNLALCKQGVLTEQMFHFPQFDTQGLLMPWVTNYATDIPYSEVYYHLGLLNTAQRFTVEIMESIPNCRKSSRCYKRLAEISLINGHYNLARKYLNALQKTQFYKRYADNVLSYIGNEEKINRHAEWGRLRQARPTEDFLFLPDKVDDMVGMLLKRNPNNRMAQEYMLAYKLLSRNLQGFADNFGQATMQGIGMLPRHLQEALAFLWSQTHSSFDGNPWNLSPQVVQQLTDFAGIFTSNRQSKAVLKSRYGNTFWYYLLCQKPLGIVSTTQPRKTH